MPLSTFFLQISLQLNLVYFIVSMPTILLAQTSAKNFSLNLSSTIASPLTSSSPVDLDIGILSLNLMRLGKMQTYKISVLMSLNSKEAKSEVFLQKFFFKELVANMLYSFSFKELQKKTILEKNYLKDLNIFINKGHINALKIKMING